MRMAVVSSASGTARTAEELLKRVRWIRAGAKTAILAWPVSPPLRKRDRPFSLLLTVLRRHYDSVGTLASLVRKQHASGMEQPGT
jgi:hypothetical protein